MKKSISKMLKICLLSFTMILTSNVIKAQDVPLVICATDSKTLRSGVVGTTYQWFKDGTLIAGATAQTYTAVLTAGSKYTVVAINEHGCASDASEAIVVYVAPPAVPAFTITDNSNCAAQTTSIVLAGSGVPSTGVPAGVTYVYEWTKVGSPTVIATTPTLTLTTVASAGDYTLTITPVWNSNRLECAKASITKTVTINAFAAKAVITTTISGYQTADEKRAGIVCEKNTVTMTANVTAGPNTTITGLTYQWYKGGVIINGATNSTLVLSNVTTADSGSYTVKTKTPQGCETTSDPAVLDVKVRLGKPTITVQ